MWRIVYLFRCVFTLLVTPLYLLTIRGRKLLKVMPPYSLFDRSAKAPLSSMFVAFKRGKLDKETRTVLDSGIYIFPTNGQWYAFVFEHWAQRRDDLGGSEVLGADLKEGYFVSQELWDAEIWKLFKEREGDAA